MSKTSRGGNPGMKSSPPLFRRGFRAAVAPAAALCLLTGCLQGQDQTPAQAPAPTPQEQSAGTANRVVPNAAAKPQKGTSKDRLFFVLPNFLTLENSQDAPPLSAADKFKATARGTFDPAEFGWYALQAGISQLRDSDPSYGQGMEGYAKRFGVRIADGTVENFFTRAVYPSLLHQDPRYYQLGKGSRLHRAGYALSRIVVTRSDSGSTQINFSEILGSATAAGISTFSYHPSDARNIKSALGVWGTQVGWDAVSYMVKEFWPDIRRKLHPTK
jgi:hypothetical protein